MTDISKLTDEELMIILFKRGASCIINADFEYKNNRLHINPTKLTGNLCVSALGCDFAKTKVTLQLRNKDKND